MKMKKKYLIVLFVLIIFFMTIGYSALNSRLISSGQLEIIPEEKVDLNAIAMLMEYDENNKFFQADFREKVKNIYINDQINIPDDKIEEIDISVNQDRKVMAYYKTNADDTSKYDLYIEGDGSLYTNFNASKTFYKFSSLASLNGIDKLNTSLTTNMENMFTNCQVNHLLDLTTFDVRKVESAKAMFQNFYGNDLKLSGWNFEVATDFSSMFEAWGIKTVDLSDWNTPKAQNMHRMFAGSGQATSFDLSSLDTANVTDMSEMFDNKYNLTSINMSGWDTHNVKNMSKMFYYNQALETLDLSSFNTSNVEDLSYAFYYCNKLTSLGDISEWNLSNVSTMYQTFYYCIKLKELDTSNWGLGNNTTLYQTFYYNLDLENLGDTNGWDLSNVTTMYQTFYSCSKLKELNASNWGLENNTTLYQTFYQNEVLESLGDTGDWDLSNVEDMTETFRFCWALTSLNGANWNLGKVTTMYYAFQDNRSLTTIENAGDWDLSSLVNMQWTFATCPKLSKIETTHWNTANVQSFDSTFNGDYELIDIDISKLRFDSVIHNYPAYGLNLTFGSCHRLSGTLNYNGTNTYSFNIFSNIVHENEEEIIINYTEENESSADKIISSNPKANLKKGTLISS